MSGIACLLFITVFSLVLLALLGVTLKQYLQTISIDFINNNHKTKSLNNKCDCQKLQATACTVLFQYITIYIIYVATNVNSYLWHQRKSVQHLM